MSSPLRADSTPRRSPPPCSVAGADCYLFFSILEEEGAIRNWLSPLGLSLRFVPQVRKGLTHSLSFFFLGVWYLFLLLHTRRRRSLRPNYPRSASSALP